MDDPGASDYMDGYAAGIENTLVVVSNWLNEAMIIEIRERLNRM